MGGNDGCNHWLTKSIGMVISPERFVLFIIQLFVMKTLLCFTLLAFSHVLMAQVAINTDATLPDPSAMLDVKSTTRGLLLPRMTQAQRNAIGSPATGIMIYQTDNTPGYYYNSGTSLVPNWGRLGDLVLPYSGIAISSNAAFDVLNTGSGNGLTSATLFASATGIIGTAPNQGIFGNATATSGAAYGVQGTSASTTGSGVTGFGSSTTGQNFGVRGLTTSSEGKGVYGYAASATGTTYGLYGSSVSSSGIGVYGEGSIAFRGTTDEDLGYGIYVTCTNATGTPRGVYSTVSSSSGYSGYFAGGKFFVNSLVGIGTVSPTVPLQVQSDGASTDVINVKNGSYYLCRIRQSSNGSGGFYLYDGANTNSIFLYGEGSSFINSGNLGIGTTAPTQLLDVNGGARIRGMTTGVVSTSVYRTADGTLITGSSDIRLKENIQPLQNSLSKVVQLKGVSFNWKADATKKRSIGFIAQDFEKVIPELAFTNEKDGYKGINYAEVTAVLAEAIKELNAKNELLQQENMQLKARMDKLEKIVGNKTSQ
jgi:trimeric autotransporter adhesin